MKASHSIFGLSRFGASPLRRGTMALLAALLLASSPAATDLRAALDSSAAASRSPGPIAGQHHMTTANNHGIPASIAAVRTPKAVSSDLPAMPNAISQYSIALSGSAESPPNLSPGTGAGQVTIDSVSVTMAIHVSFSGLVAGTTAAHIHSPTLNPGSGTAGVATTTPSFAGFPLGVSSGSFSTTLDMNAASSYNPSFITNNGGTTASAFAALFAGIDSGRAYFNIHSTTYSGGEIRGFLVPFVKLYLPLVQR